MRQRQNNALKLFDWDSLDLVKLRIWWMDPKKKLEDFVGEFGISYERIYPKRKKLNLPPRPRQTQ